MDLIRYEPASGLLGLLDKLISEANMSCAIVLNSNEELAFWAKWWDENGSSNPSMSLSADQIHKDVKKVFVLDSLEMAEKAEWLMEHAEVVHCEWNRGDHGKQGKEYVEQFLLSGYDKLNGKHSIERIKN